MKRLALVCVIALFAERGVSVHQQDATATTVLAVQRWVEAVRSHAPGEIDEAALSIERMTMDDRKALNAGFQKLLSGLAKNGRSSSAEEKRIVDLGLELSRTPGMNPFLERAAVLHGDAAMFGYGGPVLLPTEKEANAKVAPASGGTTLGRNMEARNAPPPVEVKVSPLLFVDSYAVENDGEIIGRTPADWNWVFARYLLDLIEPRHSDDAFVGTWYDATTAFMCSKRLIGEASRQLEQAATSLPNDARVLLDRGRLTELQGLPRSQQVYSDEELVALRMASQTGQQASMGLVRVGPGAPTGRTVEGANTEAERLFRRALELDPRLFEARVRLGRLLIVRAKYADALLVLQGMPAGAPPPDRIGMFFAHLFSARAERGLGHLDAAADRAHEALALFPDAQSALMASSQIAMLRADTAGAETPLRHLASLTPDADRRQDPWWIYDIFCGRDVRSMMRDMWAQISR